LNRPISLLFLVGFGMLCYLLTVNLYTGPEPADLLPADTLAVVETANLARALIPWRQGLPGKETADPNRFNFLEEFGLPVAPIAKFQAVAAFVGQIAEAPFFEEHFSEKAVMALLPDHEGRFLSPAVVPGNLVVIVRLSPDFSPFPLLNDFFGSGPAAVSVYQGESLVSLSLTSGEVLTLWQYRRLLIAALDPAPVRRCIDGALNTMVRTRTGLQLNREYQGLKHKAGTQTDLFLYADLATLRGHLATSWLDERFLSGPFPNHVAVFHRADAEYDRLSVSARLRPERLAAFMAEFRLAPPVEDPVTARRSPDNLLSFWTNWFSPQILWELIPRSHRVEAGMLMFFLNQRLAETTGKADAEFFDVFGNRFGVFIDQEAVAESIQSVAGFFLEIRDRAAADTVLQYLLADLPVQAASSEDVEIVSLLMADGLLQPSYVLTDTALIVADSPDLMQRMLRRARKDAVRGREETGVSARPGNMFLAFSSGKLTPALLSILTVLLKETEGQPSMLSLRARLLLEHLVMPLLIGMQAMEDCTLRVSAADNEILFEMDWTSGREESQGL
jgi:hypothetical protein